MVAIVAVVAIAAVALVVLAGVLRAGTGSDSTLNRDAAGTFHKINLEATH